MSRADTYDALLERARAGDEGAVARLIETCEPEIRRVARAHLGRLLRPHLDSVDVAQSVQIALLLGLREGRLDVSSPDKLIGLAAAMVRHKVADQWRRVRRRDGLLKRGIEARDLGALLASEAGGDPAVARERDEQVEQVLAELPADERSILELRLLGHSTADVARALGLNADVLRVRLSRLRKRLRDGRLLADWV